MPIPPSHPSIRLMKCDSVEAVLRLVAEGVREVLGVREKDVMLRMSKLPERIYALYVVGTNVIVLNREAFLKLPEELSGDKGLINSYTYFILLHEYLHLLGVLDEWRVYEYARRVCTEQLGRFHPATLLSMRGPPAPPPRALRTLLREQMICFER